MRISDWSSDVCSSDLFRHDRQEDQNLCNTPCAPATAGQGRRLGRLCQPRLQGAASRERQVAERIDREVLVAGGGMVGLALAVALAKAGLEVTVADRLDPSQQRDDAFDGRSSAIARGSQDRKSTRLNSSQ